MTTVLLLIFAGGYASFNGAGGVCDLYACLDLPPHPNLPVAGCAARSGKDPGSVPPAAHSVAGSGSGRGTATHSSGASAPRSSWTAAGQSLMAGPPHSVVRAPDGSPSLSRRWRWYWAPNGRRKKSNLQLNGRMPNASSAGGGGVVAASVYADLNRVCIQQCDPTPHRRAKARRRPVPEPGGVRPSSRRQGVPRPPARCAGASGGGSEHTTSPSLFRISRDFPLLPHTRGV